MSDRINHPSETKLLFISKGIDSPSTRYRALQFFPLWQKACFVPQHVTASGGFFTIANMLKQAKQADLVIVLRKTFPKPLLYLLRRLSRKLVFDFDDAIFCNTDGSASQTRMIRFDAMVRSCDHVFAGNGFLARKAFEFNPAVTVIPTCIDTEIYRVSADKPTNFVDLVWIGSSSTRKYLIDALPWLTSAAKTVPDLRLKIIADFDLPNAGLPTLPIPWSTENEARELASSHIGIAPMRDDDWSRGKCALKVLQYMAAGLPVVSSSVGANAEIVVDGKTGYLAHDGESWVKSIAKLANDPNLSHQLGLAGRQRAVENYSLPSVFSRMVEVFAP